MNVQRVMGVVVLVLGLMAAGCASTKTTQWTGHRIDEVIAKLGPPDCTGPVPPGAVMTRYVWVRRIDAPPDANPLLLSRAPDKSKIETWIFLVSPDGVIVDWVLVG